MYQYPEIRKFAGLFAQANSFTLPDGAMEQTTNIIIQDNDTVNKLNGFYTYYTPGGGTTLVNLHLYQSVLMASFTTKMSYFTDTGSSPNQTGTLTDLSGATFTIASPRMTRSAEQSGNLYWTSDSGVMKIDAYTGKVFKSGSPPGEDIRGYFTPNDGILASNAEIAYRVLFGRRDANANELLGAPSDIVILSNLTSTLVSWARVTNVVTVTQAGHNLSNGMLITVSASTGATPVPSGSYAVTNLTYSTFTFASVAADSSGTLTYDITRRPVLEFSVPREITTTTDAYFYQIFRTTQSSSGTTTPSVDFKLVEEVILSAGEITAGVAVYQDTTDDVLLTNAPQLYTNPNSQEGELQANARAPLCQDVALFQNYLFYANCTTRQILYVDVVAPGDLVVNDYVEVKVDAVTRRYVAKTGVGNKTTKSEATANAGGDLQVTSTAHGLSNGYTVYVSLVVGGTLTAGTYFIVSAAADTFKLSLTSGGAAILYSAVSYLYFEGVTDGTYPIFLLDTASSSVSVKLRNTAEGLVRAVNRDASSLVVGNYVSSIDDTPGKMRFTATGFTGVIYLRANTAGAGAGFAPPLPASFASGTQVQSTGASQPNRVYISKVGEPEAVPIVNNLQIGSKSKQILRILALRDAVIVLKEDGVYKIVGDNPQNFTSILLDNTVLIISAASAALLNNQVYFLANQGICVATDSAVQIVSRRIEKLIEPIVGNSYVTTVTGAVGYESNRTYRITTLQPAGTTAAVTYLHNSINDTWTDSDTLFSSGAVGPNNVLYLVSTGNVVLKERKVGDRTDFCGQNHTVTVVSVASGALSAVITTSAYTPTVGDIIVKNSVFSRIRSVAASGSNFAVTFASSTNLAAADTPIAYSKITSTVRMAPFHAGMVGRDKQFAQLQLHCRTYNVTRIKVSFSGQSFGGSVQTTWLDTNVLGTSGGWGYAPWGYFAWGMADGISVQTTTAPAPVIRLLVPQFQQRGTYIQPILVHEEAGESIDLQAMSWSLRAYQERVSK